MALSRGRVALVAAVLAFSPVGAHAVDEPEVLRLRATNLAAEGRCEDALSLLQRAAAGDAAALQLRGRCLIQLQRWTPAIAALEEARRLDPGLDRIDLELGVARFHQGDREGAARAVAAARARGTSGPELELYEGLVALQRAEQRAAAERFRSARRGDPYLDPIASFYEGLAWQAAQDQAQAREALERVVRSAPGTPWAQAARRALRSGAAAATRGLVDRRDIQGIQQAERPLGSLIDPGRELRRWASFSIGGEYDDNVVLRGSGVPLPDDISNESDPRLVWTGEAGIELWRTTDWAAGLVAAYYGSAHDDANRFNSQYPTLTAWLDRRIDEATTARLQYDFGYAWVDADPYLLHHTFTPALFREWGESGTSRLFVQLDWNNFLFSNQDLPAGTAGPGSTCPNEPVSGLPFARCGPAGLDEERALNRDGFGTIAGIDHVYPLTDDVALRGGLRFHRYSSRGSEYSFQGYEGILGLRALLPQEFVVDLQGSWMYAPFRNASVFPDSDAPRGQEHTLGDVRRREKATRIDVILERPINEWLTASARYSYYDNDSNTDIYDYDRDIVGGYLTVRWRR